MLIGVRWVTAPSTAKHWLLLQEKSPNLCLLSDFHDWQFCCLHGPALTCVEGPLWTRKPFRPSIHNYGNPDGCSDTGAFSTVAK